MWKVKGRLITKRTEPLVTHNLIIHDELRAQVFVLKGSDTVPSVYEIHLWVEGKETIDLCYSGILYAKIWAESEIVLRTKQKELPLLIGSLESKHSLDILTAHLQGRLNGVVNPVWINKA